MKSKKIVSYHQFSITVSFKNVTLPIFWIWINAQDSLTVCRNASCDQFVCYLLGIY